MLSFFEINYKLISLKTFNPSFIDDSTNFRKTAMRDHSTYHIYMTKKLDDKKNQLRMVLENK